MNPTRDAKLLKDFGTHLRQLRNYRKISLRKLADEADVDFSQIHRIEKGETNPSLTMLAALAKALKTDLPTLLTF